MVETIINADNHPTFLRFETSKQSNQIGIPDYISVLREVTSEEAYFTSNIAKIGWKMPEEDKKQLKLAATAMPRQSQEKARSPSLPKKQKSQQKAPETAKTAQEEKRSPPLSPKVNVRKDIAQN